MILPDWAGYLAFRDHFAEAMDPQLYSIEYLDGLILSGQARFWRSEDAAIIAEIKTFPTGARVVHGLIAAGNLEGIKTLIPLAEQWGREWGCIGGMIDSRPGWARAMKQDGYAPHQVALWKDLSDGA